MRATVISEENKRKIIDLYKDGDMRVKSIVDRSGDFANDSKKEEELVNKLIELLRFMDLVDSVEIQELQDVILANDPVVVEVD